MTKKKILILTSIEGHASIAQGIQEKIQDTYEVVVRTHRPKFFDLYAPFYQLFPGLFKIPFRIAEMDTPQLFVREYWSKSVRKIINKFVQAEQPDAIISTYYVFDDVASAECMRRDIPFFSVTADPRTFHALCILSPTTQTLLFDDTAIARAQEMLPEIQHNYSSSGWFVSNRFEQHSEGKAAMRKKLGLDPKTFTLVVCGGSDGSSMIIKILPFLLRVAKPLQLIIICGHNIALYRSIRAALRLLSHLKKQRFIAVKVLGFTTNIDEYLYAADLTIGKAGPNLLFESIACETPFFAITHISGQEDGNLDIIQEHRLGIVEENPLKAATLLSRIINNPKLLKKYAEPVKKMAAYNRASKEKILQLLAESL